MRIAYRVVIVLLLLYSVVPAAQPTFAQQTTKRADLDVIAAINQWRIDEGLWPLKVNDTLNQLAMKQAQYLMTLNDLPEGGDIHKGSQGEGPKDRAVASPFNWPTYGRSDRVSVEEIAYVGHNETAAVNYWKGSTVHRNTAMNPAYREIGAAALPHPFGYLYIVVFGGRPDVLPTLADPGQGLLYLTDERYWGAQNSSWISGATEVRLFDADGKPLTSDWQPWQATMPIPSNAGDRLYVLYSNGSIDVLSAVDLNTDRVLLPGTSFVAAPPSTTTTNNSAAPNNPGAPASVGSSSAGPEPLPTNPPAAAAAPTATRVPPPTQAPQRASSILLVYSPQSLALVNTSGRVLDLSNLEIVQGTNTLAIKRWQTPFLGAALDSFPAQDCLQVWSWNEPNDLPAPSECRIRRGIINVAPEARFWGAGTFDVRSQGTTLATCDASARRCEVSFP